MLTIQQKTIGGRALYYVIRRGISVGGFNTKAQAQARIDSFIEITKRLAAVYPNCLAAQAQLLEVTQCAQN